MDPLTSAVVAVIGKYAVDKGATLLKEAGQAAVEAAARLFEKVIGKLRADPAEAKNAERFEKNPEEFKAPVAAAVEEKMQAEPDFAAELKKLLEEFEEAKSAAAVSISSTGSGVVNTGSGTVNVRTSVTAGAGSTIVGDVNISGDVGGSGLILGTNPVTIDKNAGEIKKG